MKSGAETLVDLLAEVGIQLKSYRASHSEKIRCTKCGGGKTREASLSVTIDADGDGAKFRCHRGSCGWQDGGRVWHPGEGRRLAPAATQERVVVVPTPHSEQAKPPALYAFFEKRGIGPDTVDWFGCYIARHWFPESGEHKAAEYPAIVFPYLHGGELVNRKYRPPHKNPQTQDKNALATLFNIDSLLGDDPEVIWWVEGEPDVMALHEVGYRRAVSLKDGAPDKIRAEDDPMRQEDKRFAALETHADVLGRVKKFVLAGDMDEPGQLLREELARRLGRHRCWLVTWPDGCKDAGDTLRDHGPETVQEAIERAVPYPIDGLQKPTVERILAMRHGAPPPVLTTGVRETDLVLKFPGEGRLIVVTGIPNHGKTAWVSYVMVHLMVTHRRRFTVFSPEMQPWDQYVGMLCQIFAGKSFWGGRTLAPAQMMDDTEIAHATRWLSERLTMLVSDAEDTPPTVEWLMEKTRITLLRDGTTDLIIDPWNEVEHDQGNLTEVAYLGRKLQQLKAFALRHGCNVWIIAHPKSQQPIKHGSRKLDAPGPYDISGGAMWANKTDLGLTVHQDEGLTQIHLWKPRFRRWGRRGSIAKIEFDEISHRYRSPIGSLLNGHEEPEI